MPIASTKIYPIIHIKSPPSPLKGWKNVGWLADAFRSQTIAEPITKAVLIGMTPWLLAIPCFYFAAKLMERKISAR
jgi:hypothetical protein